MMLFFMDPPRSWIKCAPCLWLGRLRSLSVGQKCVGTSHSDCGKLLEGNHKLALEKIFLWYTLSLPMIAVLTGCCPLGSAAWPPGTLSLEQRALCAHCVSCTLEEA